MSSISTRPRAEHDDTIGQEDCFSDVMGDEENGLAAFRPDAKQLQDHVLPGERIERAEGLVHEQQPRVEQQRARKRCALRHAAGQFRRVALLEAG